MSDLENRSLGGRISSFGMYLRPIVATVILWEGVVTLGLIPTQTLPHTYNVAETMALLTADGVLINESLLTLFRSISAFLLATLIAVALGLLMVQFLPIRWFFDPLISLGFPFPWVALVPVFILWFGFGTQSILVLATINAFFPIVIGTFRAGRSVNRELLWSARSMGVSNVAATWRVILPAALPGIFNGMQISLFLSFGVTIAAEMLMSGGGLGALIVKAVRFFRPAEAIAGLIVVAVLGLVADFLFTNLRRRFLDWQ